mmetsp:Transcript_1141/g.1927  ORF Transcript_1141/g.1927 Transcript_1141/m.1927 type:complete len:407 (-) Transcript_1141:3-1223(-)
MNDPARRRDWEPPPEKLEIKNEIKFEEDTQSVGAASSMSSNGVPHGRSYQELEEKLMEAQRELGEIKKEREKEREEFDRKLSDTKKERDEYERELKEIRDRDTAVTTTTAPAPTNAPSFSEGASVLAKYLDYPGTYNGTITKVNGNGTYAVAYDDGDSLDNVDEASIQPAGKNGRKKRKLSSPPSDGSDTPEQEEEEDSEEELEEEEEQHKEVVATGSTNGDNSVQEVVLPMKRSDLVTRKNVNDSISSSSPLSVTGGTGMVTKTDDKNVVKVMHMVLKEIMNSTTMKTATSSENPNNKLQIRFFKATGTNNEKCVKRLKASLDAGHKKTKESFPFFWEPLEQSKNKKGGALICYCGHFKLVSIVMEILPERHKLADGKERCAKVLLEHVKYDEAFFQPIKEVTEN